MYKYWKAFESKEHYLYPHEVANMWQIYSCSSARGQYVSLNTMLVNEILKESSEALGKEPVYYQTKTGLKRVFDEETIAHALASLNANYEADGNVLYYPVKGRRYKFVIGEHNVTPAVKQLFPEWFEEDGSHIRSLERSYERREELKQERRLKTGGSKRTQEVN